MNQPTQEVISQQAPMNSVQTQMPTQQIPVSHQQAVQSLMNPTTTADYAPSATIPTQQNLVNPYSQNQYYQQQVSYPSQPQTAYQQVTQPRLTPEQLAYLNQVQSYQTQPQQVAYVPQQTPIQVSYPIQQGYPYTVQTPIHQHSQQIPQSPVPSVPKDRQEAIVQASQIVEGLGFDNPTDCINALARSHVILENKFNQLAHSKQQADQLITEFYQYGKETGQFIEELQPHAERYKKMEDLLHNPQRVIELANAYIQKAREEMMTQQGQRQGFPVSVPQQQMMTQQGQQPVNNIQPTQQGFPFMPTQQTVDMSRVPLDKRWLIQLQQG